MPDLADSAKESNIRDSIKRYWIDNLYTTEGVQLTFDRYLSTPSIQGHTVDKWVSINFGEMELSSLSTHMLNIYCCTRSDGEGFKLAQLRDKTYKYLTDATPETLQAIDDEFDAMAEEDPGADDQEAEDAALELARAQQAQPIQAPDLTPR